MRSASVEDYIKAIYKAQGDSAGVTTQEVAERLKVSAPAVSKMLRKLGNLRLVEHTPYQGVRLTQAGEKMALEIVRHHRLLELYLMTALGYSWDAVHEEAERLEHHISEELEARIDAFLGYPTTDPHGAPIPTLDGQVAAVSRSTLADASAPARLLIDRVSDKDAALLRYLHDIGLTPGTAIELLEQEPFGGALIVRVGVDVVRVAPGAAQGVYVLDSATGGAVAP